MIKVLFKTNDFLKLSTTSLVCAILSIFTEIMLNNEATLEETFLKARDGYLLLNGQYHASAFTHTLHLILIIFILSSIFSRDIDIAKAFIFNRVDNIKKWFSLKFLQSYLYCFFACAFYHATIVLVLILLGFKAENPFTVFLYVLWGIVTEFLVLAMFITLYSVISLYFKPHLAAMSIAILFEVGIAMFWVLRVEQVQYYLLTSFFISWHLESNINSAYYAFPTWSYYVAMCVVTGVELIAANKIIKKTDFI